MSVKSLKSRNRATQTYKNTARWAHKAPCSLQTRIWLDTNLKAWSGSHWVYVCDIIHNENTRNHFKILSACCTL